MKAVYNFQFGYITMEYEVVSVMKQKFVKPMSVLRQSQKDLILSIKRNKLFLNRSCNSKFHKKPLRISQ